MLSDKKLKYYNLYKETYFKKHTIVSLFKYQSLQFR